MKPISKTNRKFEDVLIQIKDEIVLKNLKPGDKLYQFQTGNLIETEERKQHDIIEAQFKNIEKQWVNILAEGSQHRKNFYASLEQAEKVKECKIS